MGRALSSKREATAAQVTDITSLASLPVDVHFIISEIEKAPYNLFFI